MAKHERPGRGKKALVYKMSATCTSAHVAQHCPATCSQSELGTTSKRRHLLGYVFARHNSSPFVSMPGVRALATATGSPVLIVVLLVAAGLLLVGTVALTCPTVQADAFLRYTVPPATNALHKQLCLLSDASNTDLNLLVLAGSTIFGLAASLYVTQASISAFSSLIGNGLSASYARVLLRLPGQVRSMANLRKDEHQHFRRAFILLVVLGMPALCSVVSAFAGSLYFAQTLRLTTYQANITSIPDWIGVDNLTSTGWYSPIQGANTTRDLKLPSGPQSRSLANFSTNDVGPITGQGSGLQTMLLSHPPGSPVRAMAVLPLRNALLEAVPGSIGDLTIEQEVLLIDQKCSYGGFWWNNGIMNILHNGQFIALPDTLKTSLADDNATLSWIKANVGLELPKLSGIHNWIPFLNDTYLAAAGWDLGDVAAFIKLNASMPAYNL